MALRGVHDHNPAASNSGDLLYRPASVYACPKSCCDGSPGGIDNPEFRPRRRSVDLKVLFIGGTGIISSACSELATERGMDLTLLTRGHSIRPLPQDVGTIQADMDDAASVESALAGLSFDVIVNWIVFHPDQIERDLKLFKGKTGQYIFISSASAYETPPSSLPITESTPLSNPFWEYSRNKIACEQRLMQAWQETHFPITIVRPSHTYDKTLLPFTGRYTVIDRMRRGRPVIVHGDGTSLWTLTHHRDFAVGFLGLLGNTSTLGEAYHITSDFVYTWNRIFRIMANAAGVSEPELVHVASETLADYDAEWGANLLGDKSHSMIFNNKKIKSIVPEFNPKIPFENGAKEIMTWIDAYESRQIVSPELDQLYDRIIADIPRGTL